MTFPVQGTPSLPDILEVLAYARRVADSILRNNPLTDAVVGDGLVRWLGNYVSTGTTSKVNFLWIGEFQPSDTNLPGNPPQRGFSLVRDDSRGGVSALAMFDSNPSGGGGLKQQLFITSGDGERLFAESRDGGWMWPETTVPMAPLGTDLLAWPGTQNAAYDTLWEGRVNIVGNNIAFRVWGRALDGAAGTFRVRLDAVPGVSPDITSPEYSFGAGGNTVADSTVNVSALRGYTVTVRVEARRDNAVGSARVSCISMRCFSTT